MGQIRSDRSSTGRRRNDRLANRQRAVVPRRDGPQLLLWFTATCALTIALTRVYLLLTGYPQIGGSVFHLAHALWGGLLLTVAVLLVLALSTRWALKAAAVAGGVGAGLFVDEVGKFITQQNDYFFPLAATIVYAFLIVLAAVTVMLFRYTRDTGRAHLAAALELIPQLADGTLSGVERDELAHHLDQAVELSVVPERAHVARALRDAVADLGIDEDADRRPRLLERLEQRPGPDTFRKLARVLLALQALLGIAALAALPWAWWTERRLVPREIGQWGVGSFAYGVAIASFIVTGLAGLLALRGAAALSQRRLHPRTAERFGNTALIVLLTIGNTLGAYTSQFLILAEAFVQMVALASLNVWYRMVRPAEREPAQIQRSAEAPAGED